MKDTHNRIEWDEEKYRAFQRRYDEAINKNEEMFVFQDREYITLFAKYVLEYLRMGLRLEK
jgi:hypothetical protein